MGVFMYCTGAYTVLHVKIFYPEGRCGQNASCGGGGGNNELPKKKDNEDELFFALRCHQMAKTMHAPKYRLRR